MATYMLARNYWLILLCGLIAVLCGLAAFIWPTPALATLRLFLGLYFLADGLLTASAGLPRHNGSRPWWFSLIEGEIGIGAAVLALVAPGLTVLAVVYLVAVWAIATGIVELSAAIRLRAEMDNEGFLALSGVLSVTLGAVLMIWPGVAASGLVWRFGAYALVFGLMLFGRGLQLWDWRRTAGPTPLHFAPGLNKRRTSRSPAERISYE